MAAIVGTAIGLLVGAVVSGVVVRRRLRHAVSQPSGAHELSSIDREQLSAEFATHASSVRRELSRYADALADGDGDLRDRLRRFEAGATR